MTLKDYRENQVKKIISNFSFLVEEKCGAAEGRATDSPAPSFLAGSYNYGFFCPTPEISAAPTTISADGL